jgi:hypothetical protein
VVSLVGALPPPPRDPILMDLDSAGGDVCCYLGLDPRRGLFPLLRMDGHIPGTDRLLGEAETHAGIRVIGGFPQSSELASTGVLETALAAAQANNGLVIADIGRVSESTSPLATRADLVLAVVRADLVSVLGAERAVGHLEAAGIRRDVIGLVISCHERRRPADLVEVQDALRLPILASVPLDQRGARKALLEQRPVATRRLRRAFDELSFRVEKTLNETRRNVAMNASVWNEATR